MNLYPSARATPTPAPRDELVDILRIVTGSAKGLKAKRKAIETGNWKCSNPPAPLRAEISAWIAYDDACSASFLCSWYPPDSEEYASRKCDRLLEAEKTLRVEYLKARSINESVETAKEGRAQ
jgi:hypothetical protein